MGSGKTKIAAKVLVTVILLCIVFRSVDLGMVAQLLARFEPLWAVAALLLTALIIASDATLFAACMRKQSWHVPFGSALIYSVVGWFFSNLAPSTVGGDLFRGVQAARQGAPMNLAVRAIVSMRLVSLATLFVVMLAGLPIALDRLGAPHDAALLGMVVAVAGGALGAVFVFAHVPVPTRLLERWPVLRRLAVVSQDVRRLLAPNVQSVAIWAAGLVQHLLRVGILAALAAGLGQRIPLATLFAMVPAALLVAMLPVSLGGWGMREAAFVYFLGAAGVTAEAALSLSVAFGFLRIVVGAIGGVTWALVGKDRYRIEARSG
jgi:uncharacterized membrane protein YbhN (UPF0104 family)